ncbi:hypothetical protein LCGC14_1142520 [marine sediment metagenome]|uniref:Uncharacterized protein n=1 Tax=marine sediment metagenome TaxID=412755 RepID=A0A0F9M2N0_9ZZZZ
MKLTERTYGDPSAAYDYAAKATLGHGVYRILVTPANDKNGVRVHTVQVWSRG